MMLPLTTISSLLLLACSLITGGRGDIKYHDPSEFEGHREDLQERQHHAHKLGEQMDQEHLEKHAPKYFKIPPADNDGMSLSTFSTFDLDKDGYIDGLELFKSKVLMAEDHGHEEGSTFEVLVQEVDKEMSEIDQDEDGQISLLEFHKARKGAKAKK